MGAAQVIAPLQVGAGATRSERADGELVDAYIGGDRRAFDELYRRHHHRVLRFCRARTKTPHAAEDIAHDVIVRALTYLEGFDRDRPMWPWLKTIARNELADHYGASSRTVDLTDDALPDEDPTAHEHTIWLGERHALAQAMQCLSPRDRTVLTLKYCNDWDSSQLEDFFDVERPALYKLLQRARDRLLDAYEELADSKLAGVLPAPLLARLQAFTDRVRARLTGSEGCLVVAPNCLEALASAAAAVAIGVGLAAVAPGVSEASQAIGSLSPVDAARHGSVVVGDRLGEGSGGDTGSSTPDIVSPIATVAEPVAKRQAREHQRDVTVEATTEDVSSDLPATTMSAGTDTGSEQTVGVAARVLAYVPGEQNPAILGAAAAFRCNDGSTTVDTVCAGLDLVEEIVPPPDG